MTDNVTYPDLDAALPQLIYFFCLLKTEQPSQPIEAPKTKITAVQSYNSYKSVLM